MPKKNGHATLEKPINAKTQRRLNGRHSGFSPQPEEITLRPGEGLVAGVVSRDCPRRTRKPRLIRLAPGDAVRLLAVKSLTPSAGSSVSPDNQSRLKR